jgi:hypothetical protein
MIRISSWTDLEYSHSRRRLQHVVPTSVDDLYKFVPGAAVTAGKSAAKQSATALVHKLLYIDRWHTL